MSRYIFWRDIATISTASILSQIILFATTPVFTRLYDPATFGIAAVFAAVIFTISPVSSFSYNHAIVLATGEDEAASISILSFLLTLFVSLLLLIPFGVLHETFFSPMMTPGLRFFIWLIPLSVLVKGTSGILFMASSREKNFALQGRAKVIQTVSERALVIGAGLLGKAEVLAIIASRFVSYIFEAAPFYRIVAKLSAFARTLSWQALQDVASKYRQFPLFANWTFIFANLSAYISVFIIAFFFTSEFIGLYVISERVVCTPLMVFGDSLKSVYYQKAASQQGDFEQLRHFFQRLRDRILAYSIFPSLMLLFFGPDIFRLFLGERWEAAGSIAGLICVLAFFQFLSSPVMSLVNVLGKQKPFLYFTVLLFIARCLSFIIGGMLAEPMTAVWILTLSGSMTYLAINGWIDRLLSISSKVALFNLLKYACLSAGLLSSVTFLNILYPGMLVLLVALTCASVFYYAVVVRIVEGKTLNAFVRQLTHMATAR